MCILFNKKIYRMRRVHTRGGTGCGRLVGMARDGLGGPRLLRSVLLRGGCSGSYLRSGLGSQHLGVVGVAWFRRLTF
jgi:hypothetical protein